ncbi:MAG TPA: ATP-dependent sacrificial sulfur transferase LarE [Armatimonadota bacterium]|jgi:uncharacterized protein
MSPNTSSLETKAARVREILQEFPRVAVAFSGGVDSTLLLRLALDTLGAAQVLAITGVTELIPAREVQEAEELAQALGARTLFVREQALALAQVAANPADRCYHCKAFLFARFRALAEEAGFPVLLDGANADDVGDWRPGQQAARELGVRSPLQEAGMTKADVRALSRALGLPTWEKPSYACLASRVPYGTPLTREILAAIEAGEEYLRALGFVQLRVRHHGELARIELVAEEIPRLLDPALRTRVTARFRELGYRYVAVDLQGYRTGSMNEVL